MGKQACSPNKLASKWSHINHIYTLFYDYYLAIVR